MHFEPSVRFFGLVAAALLLAGCAAPAQPLGARAVQAPAEPDDLPLDGAGRVLNAPPRVLEFRGSLDRADNGGGSVETFTALVADDNAEADLAALELAAEGPGLALRHGLAAKELAQRFNPGYGDDGFAVWDAVPQDGKVQVMARVSYPYGAEPGLYEWVLTVRDAAGEEARSEPDRTAVDPIHVVEVAGAVTADGRTLPAENWGGWSAAPGAKDVRSVTFLKVENKGTSAGARFVVDFTSRDFVGKKDAEWRVPLDGNVRFAAWEASPDQLPRSGAFAFGPVSPDGSVELAFERSGTVLYVAYEVVQVPTPLPSQLYHASATVTAL